MHVTLKTEYALLALYMIMQHGRDKPVTRRKIAEIRDISEYFLEKVLLSLQKGELVRSVRGPGGGFTLTRPPKDISLWDVYVAVDDPDFQVKRCNPKSTMPCEIWDQCRVKHAWFKFNEVFKDSASAVTLADI